MWLIPPPVYVGSPEELYQTIHSFIVFFIFLTAFSMVSLIAVVVVLIRISKAKQREKESAEFASHVIAAQEAERARISAELHDTLAQDLRAALSKAEGDEMRAILRTCIGSIRSLCYNLAPPDCGAEPLSNAIQSLCVRFREETALDVSLALRADALPFVNSPALTDTQKLHIYRIVQESLSNVHRHARAEEVSVIARRGGKGEPDGLYLCVADDGTGFDAEAWTGAGRGGKKHFGLRGMRQRAKSLGGTLTVTSAHRSGTEVTLFIPVGVFGGGR